MVETFGEGIMSVEEKFTIKKEQTAHDPDIKKLFKDMAGYFPTLIIPGILSFITIPIVTRLFTPEIYGNYVLVVSTVSILSIIIGWISISIIRFYPTYERDLKLNEFYTTIIKLSFISIIAVYLIFLAGIIFTKSRITTDIYRLMHIGSLVFILSTCFGILLNFLRAKRQVSWYAGFCIWRNVTGLGFGIALIMFFHYGIEGLLWGSILSIALALPLLWKIAVKKSQTIRKGISIPLTFELVKYGFPLAIGNLASWILSLSDRYVLGFFRGSYEVGIYSASYGISEKSIGLIVSLFQIASGAIIWHIWEKKEKKASQEFISKLTRYYLIFCLPAVIGLSVMSKLVISIVTAPQYHEGYRIIPLVTLSAFFLGLTQRFGVGFCYYKKTYLITFCLITSGLINVVLNFLLVPKYGYIAAAWTTLISYVFFLVLQVLLSRRFFIWEFPFKSLEKSVCASGVMGIVVYYIGNSLTSSNLLNLILGIVVGVVVYLIMLFLLREFKSSEIQAVLDLKDHIFAKKKL